MGHIPPSPPTWGCWETPFLGGRPREKGNLGWMWVGYGLDLRVVAVNTYLQSCFGRVHGLRNQKKLRIPFSLLCPRKVQAPTGTDLDVDKPLECSLEHKKAGLGVHPLQGPA